MAREMKDSGVGWIGKIPQSWAVKRMKDSFISNNRTQPNSTVLSLSYGNVIIKDMEEKKGVTPESYDSYQGVLPGDVVLRLTDLQNDQKSLRVGRATTKGIITSAYLCVSSRTLNDRYSAYLLQNVGDIQKLFYGLGGGVRQSMKFADLAELLFPLPPKQDQIAIADYLDQQTALIDQRLSTLEEKKTVLAELRKATIHEAVTKGLNKNASMKDSGVAWIGDIPKDWEIKRLKSLLREPLTYGASEAADSIDPENPRFVRITDIENGNLREDTFRSLPLDIAKPYLLKEGDVLLARSGATVGKSFFYQRSWGRCCFAGYLIRARLNPDVCVPKFFYACCQSTFYWQYISDTQIQSTIQNVNAEKYANLYLPCPSIVEQLAIANHLDQQTQQIDAQLATLDEQAQVLKELRKAIIHEAVTGKIDLSGAVSGKEKR